MTEPETHETGGLCGVPGVARALSVLVEQDADYSDAPESPATGALGRAASAVLGGMAGETSLRTEADYARDFFGTLSATESGYREAVERLSGAGYAALGSDLRTALGDLGSAAGAAIARLTITPEDAASAYASLGGVSADDLARSGLTTWTAAGAAAPETEDLGSLCAVLGGTASAVAALSGTVHSLDASREFLVSTLAVGKARDRDRAQVARLHHDAYRLTRSSSALAVELVRLVTAEVEAGHLSFAGEIARAAQGDPEALALWHDLDGASFPLASVVLDLLRRIAETRTAAESVIVGTVEVVTRLALAGAFPRFLPPPRRVLAGSLDRCAP